MKTVEDEGGIYAAIEKVHGVDIQPQQIVAFTRLSIPTDDKEGKAAQMTCEVCQSCVIEDMRSLGCEHFYCLDCYKQFWSGKIVEGNDPDLLRCICHKCPFVTNCEVAKAILEPEVYTQYLHLLSNKILLNNNKKLRACPTANCEAVVKVCFGELSRVDLSALGCVLRFAECAHDMASYV